MLENPKNNFSFVKNYVLAFRMLASAAWGYFAAKAKFVYKASRIFFQAKKCLASLLGFLTNIYPWKSSCSLSADFDTVVVQSLMNVSVPHYTGTIVFQLLN